MTVAGRWQPRWNKPMNERTSRLQAAPGVEDEDEFEYD
jgi:hypothetical protein